MNEEYIEVGDIICIKIPGELPDLLMSEDYKVRLAEEEANRKPSFHLTAEDIDRRCNEAEAGR